MATLASGEVVPERHAMPEIMKYRPRACQSCARSKLKCEWLAEPGTSSCRRCAKIKTNCVLPQVITRKRRGPSTRVGQLENKLDGIISLLNAGQRVVNDQTQHNNRQGPLAETQAQSRVQGLPNPSSNAAAHGWPETRPASEHSNPTLSSVTGSTAADSPMPPHIAQAIPSDYINIVPGFRMTFAEADSALGLYRSTFTPYFPFVPVPVTMTASELYNAAPFLLRTLLQVVAPQTLPVQRSVHRWFRQYIAEQVVVEKQRRLELLQAILVFVAWGDFQFYIEAQATDLIQLAEVLVVDLRLDRPPISSGDARLSFISDAIRKIKGPRKEGHTLDDMRAMLGFSYLYSVVTTLFRRTRSFVFTPYITHCCDTLLAAQEYDSDKFLVALIHMQRLLTRVSDIIPNPDQDENSCQAVDAPLYVMMVTTRNELDKLIRSQPPEVQSNVLLWTHYHGVTMRLYEPAIYMRPSSSSYDLQESSRRTEILSSCLQSVKDFFAAYASIPLDSLGAMPLVATAYMAFAVVTASRILLLDDSDWKASLARLNFDFAAACQNLGDRFEQADRLAQSLGRRRKFDNDVDASVLAAYSVKIMWIRQWYLVKASSEARSAANTAGASTAQLVESDQLSPSNDASLLPVELDEAFWSALLDSNGSSIWAGLNPEQSQTIPDASGC